jgi:hypothetical protein
MRFEIARSAQKPTAVNLGIRHLAYTKLLFWFDLTSSVTRLGGCELDEGGSISGTGRNFFFRHKQVQTGSTATHWLPGPLSMR